MKAKLWIAAFACLTAFVSCDLDLPSDVPDAGTDGGGPPPDAGSDAGTPGDELDEEGCEHLADGPAVSVTATATASGAPAIDADHQRYDIQLTPITGGKGGYVTFAADDEADFVFFLGANVPVTFRDAQDQEVEPEASATSSTTCTEIKGRYVVPLEVGMYTLSFGPTTEDQVSVVVEEAGHEHP